MKVLLICSLVLASIFCKAQQPTVLLHSGVGMNSYKGDLGDYDGYSLGFHAGIQLNKKKRLNGNLNVGFGSVTGENRNFAFQTDQVPTPSPNRFFKSNFFYLNYGLNINLYKREYLIIYLSQGIGVIRYSPEDEFGGSLQSQTNTRLNGETYRNASLFLPTKLGVIYLLTNSFGFGFQAGFFNLQTDYLDNISQLAETGNDNILEMRFSFYAPLKFKIE